MTLSLIGLCGSLRAGSYNRKLMKDAALRFGASEFIDADLRLPLYDGDLEEAEGIPASVQALAEGIFAADAVLIASPEYNQSFSGVLKNALDWVSRVKGSPWRDKPVALLSATAGRSGGARSNYALRLAMASFRPVIINGPEVLVAAPAKEFDDQGRLTSERYVKAMDELMTMLRDEAERRRMN